MDVYVKKYISIKLALFDLILIANKVLVNCYSSNNI